MLCTVKDCKLQCHDDYQQRVSLTSGLQLRGLTQSDSGVYTVRDKKTKEVTYIYRVTVDSTQPSGQKDNISRWVLDAGFWTLGSGRWALDAGFWTLGSGRWVLDAGFWTLGSGRWVLDAGFWTLGPGLRSIGSELYAQQQCAGLSQVQVRQAAELIG
ncbi:hypothetical protein NFI96_031374 [Prochilodus magdalenae]|nr:hypothetical protein NFI96_031374 [Prochilodus magdalenae]